MGHWTPMGVEPRDYDDDDEPINMFCKKDTLWPFTSGRLWCYLALYDAVRSFCENSSVCL